MEQFISHKSNAEAMVKGVVPTQEYYLHGSILDSNRETLLYRLQGSCDGDQSKFLDHEQVFVLKGQALNAPDVNVSIRKSLLPVPSGAVRNPCQMRYTNDPDSDRSKPTMVRTCLDIAVNEDQILQYLKSLGFSFEYEFVSKGYVFRRGRTKISVSKIHRVLVKGQTEKIEPLTESNLIEFSCTAPAGTEHLQDEIKAYADQLKPHVNIDKQDVKRLVSTPGFQNNPNA
ncbi:DgyrCDS4710 [Dimorphilus gyrociliatus]|uniref:Mediator of RNA polymerase II transcription subunit 18 n=1 Tax=Dimorphilus gyrociliatus TaxID=2664684 RepID=A0A7I8VJZ9_9ANNE|nr:DgyrCDS4710 [Dimorphilus gyrociliatus]